MIQFFVLLVWVFLIGAGVASFLHESLYLYHENLSDRLDKIEGSINQLEAKVNQATAPLEVKSTPATPAPNPPSSSKHTKTPLSPSPKSLVYDEDGSMMLCEKTGVASCRQVFDSYDAAFRGIMGNPYDTTILRDLVREYKWKHNRRHISLRYEKGGPSMVEYHGRPLKSYE
jgi:hypothetical protein